LVEGYSRAEPVWITREDARIISEYLGAAHGEESQIVKTVSSTTRPVAPKVMTFEEKFEETCNSCHSSDRITRKAEVLGADKERWKPIVLAMQKKGAEVADEEVDEYVDFLSKFKK
jgi:cytochrome c5